MKGTGTQFLAIFRNSPRALATIRFASMSSSSSSPTKKLKTAKSLEFTPADRYVFTAVVTNRVRGVLESNVAFSCFGIRVLCLAFLNECRTLSLSANLRRMPLCLALCILLFVRIVPFSAPTVWHTFTPLANKYNAINLGQGFPGWAPPKFVTEAAIKAFTSTNFMDSQYARYGWLVFAFFFVSPKCNTSFALVRHPSGICIRLFSSCFYFILVLLHCRSQGYMPLVQKLASNYQGYLGREKIDHETVCPVQLLLLFLSPSCVCAAVSLL